MSAAWVSASANWETEVMLGDGAFFALLLAYKRTNRAAELARG